MIKWSCTNTQLRASMAQTPKLPHPLNTLMRETQLCYSTLEQRPAVRVRPRAR